MNIKDIDSITLTVSDINRAVRFYHEVFDLPIINDFDRPAVRLGHHRLEFETPTDKPEISASTVALGTADLAFSTKDNLEATLSHLTNYAVEIDDGPIDYTGAQGDATALWVRDPDHNLIKIVTYK